MGQVLKPSTDLSPHLQTTSTTPLLLRSYPVFFKAWATCGDCKGVMPWL